MRSCPHPLAWPIAMLGLACASDDGDDAADTGGVPTRSVHVTLTNVAVEGAPWPSADAPAKILLSVGLWALHDGDGALLRAGVMATGTGIETLAEQGNATAWLDALATDPHVTDAGFVDARVPGQSYETDPIGPGTARSFDVEAGLDDRLSVAVMFVQSNDMMLATRSEGIDLDVSPHEVFDVTRSLSLWDAGTEQNEPPGTGPNQAPRQESPDAGIDELGTVQPIDTVDAAGFTYPAVATFARLEIEIRSP